MSLYLGGKFRVSIEMKSNYLFYKKFISLTKVFEFDWSKINVFWSKKDEKYSLKKSVFWVIDKQNFHLICAIFFFFTQQKCNIGAIKRR